MEFFDVKEIIIHLGVWVTFAIIFAESGLLIGFFLPGDSLIFTAGLLASQDYFNIWYFLVGGFIAAVVGDNVGYYFGKKVGPRIFTKEESVFFHKDHIRKAEEFYKKYGPATLVIARFTPVVRTFAPILAGVGGMHYNRFFFYNVFGAFLWVWGIGLMGYYAGNNIPGIDRYVLPVLVGIVILSIIPGIIAYLKAKSKPTAKAQPGKRSQ